MAKFLDFPNIKRRLALSILPGSDVEAPASDRSSGHCLLSMPKMTEIAMRISRLCWGLLPMSLTLTGCLSPIATREAVQQVEDTFAAHRAELDELATTAIAELERSGESALKLPDQPFYDRASVAETFGSEAIAVDFVVEEFYLPLVYVDTDEPQDIHDTCANGGRVVKPLAPHWYICQRDGN